MQIKDLRSNPASTAKTRWTAYAAAGAATALVGSNSAEADIHYSGLLNVQFPPHRDRLKTFQLGDPDRVLVFYHGYNTFVNRSAAKLNFSCPNLPVSVQGGTYGSEIGYVEKLSFGQNISAGYFGLRCSNYVSNFLASGDRLGDWRDPGIGYIGFRITNNFRVFQYGWIRVKMTGQPYNGFIVKDFAYADPGEPITAGQRSSSGEQAPDEGSLGGLALGAVGLLSWRKSRSRTARLGAA